MAKAKAASGIAADIAAMKAIGMSDQAIQERILGLPASSGPTLPSADAQGRAGTAAPQNAHQRQDNNLGRDEEVVRRHQEFLATYKPQVLEKTYEVTLDKRRADYVEQWAGWQSAIRGEPISPERAIDLMIRRLWQLDPDRAHIQGGKAVPRQHFHAPATGTPPSVPQG